MSSIPPNWLGSLIQSHGAQSRAGQAKAAENAAAADRTADTGENRSNTIENDDTDSSVYADAEGAGSHGPGGDEEPVEEELERDEDEDEGQEPGGLDVQA